MFTSRAEYASNFGLCEQAMATLAAAVTAAVKGGRYTSTGLWEEMATAKGDAIFQTRRVLDAVAALARKDRETAEEVLTGPEPAQTAETLAALAYQQNLAMRQFPAGDMRVVAALADAVEDGDAIRAQVLADLAAGIPWSIDNLARMEQVEQLKRRAIELRADPPRQAALAALALLDGDREAAGVDGKVETIGYAVGDRCEAILQRSGEDLMVGSFRLDWVTPVRGSFFPTGVGDHSGTMRILGIVTAPTR